MLIRLRTLMFEVKPPEWPKRSGVEQPTGLLEHFTARCLGMGFTGLAAATRPGV